MGRERREGDSLCTRDTKSTKGNMSAYPSGTLGVSRLSNES